MNPRLHLIIFLLVGAVCSARGQGQVLWGNQFTGVLQARVYGFIPGHDGCRLTGNTPNGVPAGTQDYAGAPLLAGTGYTMGLFLGNSSADAAAQMTSLQTAPFRTGTAAGFVFAQTYSDPTRVPGTTGVHVQFRAWDNRGGTVTSWAQVIAVGVASGFSDPFPLVGPLGGSFGGMVFPVPSTTGARSFNIATLGGPCPVPEPSTWVIIAMSAGLFLLFRRRR